MSRTPKSIMMFAVAQDGRAVHIDEVSNGAQCRCTCPECHTPLIAKNGGDDRAHHFAHDGRQEEHSCSETALHFAAKQIISDNRKVLLPERPLWGGEGGSVLEFSEVLLEHKLVTNADSADEYIVADCLGVYGPKSIIIEIAVHHQVDLDKSIKLQILNMPSIEISLIDFAEIAWDWESLAKEVLFSAQRRKWLWQPDQTPLSLEETKELENKTEWIFEIAGRMVWVKKLPYGNIRIFHRPNSYLRGIVQPLCQNKGFWNPKFNNWIVFDRFKDDVLRCLSESGRLIGS